jgi:hypothetical protein
MESTLSNEEHEGGNGRLRAHKQKFPPTNDNYLSLGWPDPRAISGHQSIMDWYSGSSTVSQDTISISDIIIGHLFINLLDIKLPLVLYSG